VVTISGVGAANGPSRAAFNRWFRYPAGFSDFALDRALAYLDLTPGSIVADPFAGAAVGGTFVTSRGLRFVGIEAHPLVAELAQLKFAATEDPEGLVVAARSVAEVARRKGTRDEHVLLRACFEPSTLGVLAALRDEIKRSTRSRWRVYLKWAHLATLRDCANVRVAWPYQRPQVARKPVARHARERFLQRAGLMAEDLSTRSYQPDGRVVAGDARTAAAWHGALGQERADACLTSPPYLNNYDYADGTRLEAYFWGFADSWRTLVDRVRRPMITATTQQTSRALALAAATQLSQLKPLEQEIHRLSSALAGERERRPRGKEYDALLVCYLVDMWKVLARMRRSLRPGAAALFVIGDSAPYGVYIDTPELIARLAESLGFQRVTVEHLRDRGLRWRGNGSRHAVRLTEQLLVLRGPH